MRTEYIGDRFDISTGLTNNIITSRVKATSTVIKQ